MARSCPILASRLAHCNPLRPIAQHHDSPHFLRTAVAHAVLLAMCGTAWAQTSTTPAAHTAEAPTAAPSLRQVDVVDSTAGAAATPARRAQSSSRLGLSVLETPRSVSVIDNVLLEQQMATTERDVLRNASGVSARSEYYGSYSQFAIRGCGPTTPTTSCATAPSSSTCWTHRCSTSSASRSSKAPPHWNLAKWHPAGWSTT